MMPEHVCSVRIIRYMLLHFHPFHQVVIIRIMRCMIINFRLIELI